MSGKISEPIKELHEATVKLRNRDFTAKVDIHTGDELQELGEAFNITAGALKSLEGERKQIDQIL